MRESGTNRRFIEPRWEIAQSVVDSGDADLDFVECGPDHSRWKTSARPPILCGISGAKTLGRENCGMNKWVLAAILAAAAVIMYVSIIYKLA